MDPAIFDYMICLALCHSVIIEQSESGVKYNASSPDELAFINFTRFCGM
jgi:phospholipid-transporting ATPase